MTEYPLVLIGRIDCFWTRLDGENFNGVPSSIKRYYNEQTSTRPKVESKGDKGRFGHLSISCWLQGYPHHLMLQVFISSYRMKTTSWFASEAFHLQCTSQLNALVRMYCHIIILKDAVSIHHRCSNSWPTSSRRPPQRCPRCP